VVLTDCFGVRFDRGTHGMNFSHQFGAFALEFLQHFGKFLQAAGRQQTCAVSESERGASNLRLMSRLSTHIRFAMIFSSRGVLN
jgi:hypothetical protein